MFIFSDAIDIFSALIIFIFGIFVSLKACRYFSISNKRALIIYLWHTVFCVAYFFYSAAYGGDSTFYYEESLESTYDFSLGTSFVVGLTRIFSAGLNFSIFSIFLIFNIFGVIGLIAFDGSLKKIISLKEKPVRIFSTIIIFLPSLSFWSSAIGKDGIAFMAAGLALWAALNIRFQYMALSFSVILMFLVRPHIAAILVMSIFISVLTRKKMRISQRFVFGGLAVLCAAVIVPLALTYAGVTGDNSQGGDVSSYVDERQSYNQEGGGAIDITSLNPPMQLIAYIFRPLPFEAHSIAAFASSIDNSILFLLFLIGIFSIFKHRKRLVHRLPDGYELILSFASISWVVLALTTANSGIAVRQKWMFLPMLILLVFSVIGKPRSR